MEGVTTEMKFPIPGGYLAAKAWGPPEGRPVLCLHGWLDNANSFDRLIPLLPRDYHYVALDFSGHGLSSHWSPDVLPFHLCYVMDALRVIQALNWSKFTIMGHSMGGQIGGTISSIFPHMVDKLIILDNYGFRPIEQGKLGNSMSQMLKKCIALDEKKSTKVYSHDEALERLLKVDHSPAEEGAKILLQRGAKQVPGGVIFTGDVKARVFSPLLLSIEQCMELIKNVTASVLLIIAKEGLEMSKPYSLKGPFGKGLLQGFRSNLKERFHFEVVDGSHYVHLNNPETVSGFISHFLQKDQRIKARL